MGKISLGFMDINLPSLGARNGGEYHFLQARILTAGEAAGRKNKSDIFKHEQIAALPALLGLNSSFYECKTVN